MHIILILILIILILITVVGIMFSNMVIHNNNKPYEKIMAMEIENNAFDADEFKKLTKENVSIKSPYGYELKGYFIKSESPSKKIMIFCHGVTVSRYTSIKYMNIFLKKGYDALIYDHRNHGESGGENISYGYFERYDLKAVVDWIKENYDYQTIGLHGESMGSGILLMYAGTVEDGADFYIADCPYSDFYEQICYRLKEDYNLPRFLVMPIANLFILIRGKYKLKDIAPIKYIKNIKKPVLFIHSKDDMYIPCEMSKKMYEEKEEPKSLYIAPKGDHAMSYIENRKEYIEKIDEFLNKNGL